MQHRLEEQQQRAPNPSDAFSAGVLVSASQRFGEVTNSLPSAIQYPMQGYQVSQNNHHSSPIHHTHGVQSQPHHQAGLPQGSSQPQAHSTSTNGQQQQQFQRLKVEDALSYLDQVKLQFGNQPQVYNDFLDIMKEFKSQTIDTPGVINRVSNLFKGHPELIVGFNTFLPPGYKIEVQANEINVHQPGQAVVSITTNSLNSQQSGTLYSVSISLDKNNTKPPNSTPAAPNSTSNSQGSHSQSARTNNDGLSAPCNNQHNNNSQAQQASQPVEFNHAINYVNKIKNRFQGQPEIYKAFLEILHTYQKEQRNLKECLNQPGYKPLTEAEVYAQVANLFRNQEDLLTEFGQFLPDANGSSYLNCELFSSRTYETRGLNNTNDSALGVKNDHSSTVKKPGLNNKTLSSKTSSQLRRPSASQQPPTKKLKPSSLKDVSLAEAGKYGSLNEFAFFDKVRKALRHQDVYENFLRCLFLFNQEVISRGELVQLIQNFLGKYPELFKWFKDFLGYKEAGGSVDAIPHGATGKERISGDLAMEIDFSTCKRFGASYRALPSSYPPPKCSGRTALCREVLNDTWVSFPSWSEDSTFVTSKKTQYEEHIYRCEDERFELDVVIETNLSTIKVLETVHKKLSRMAAEDAAKFRLDSSLGGCSEVLHRKAIQRIYGDKAPDIIDGLKKNPVVAVPLVLRRLKAKEEEWRESQRQFNKIWREQNEKYYLKSLDHQGINFKQNDVKAIRSKALLNEIETIYDERQEQADRKGTPYVYGPHLTFVYKDKTTIEDAASLIVHHMKRQTGIHKEDKQKIKQLLSHFIPDLFFTPRGELSDDEQDKDEEMEIDEGDKPLKEVGSVPEIKEKEEVKKCPDMPISDLQKRPVVNGNFDDSERDLEDDDVYSLFFVNNNWYLFFRLHQLLCERLCKLYTQALSLAEEEAQWRKDRKESTAIALRLKAPSDIEPDDFYPYFLEMVKNLLDGNLEAGQYEDQLREMFGIHAYIAFTMDKLVQNLVRQLQHIVSDETCTHIIDYFHEERRNDAVGGRIATCHQRINAEAAYQRRVEHLLSDENCFKIMIYKQGCKLTIELLDTDHDQSDEPVEVEKWSEYVEKYVAKDSSISEDLREHLTRKAVFLPRNRRYKVQNRDLKLKSESEHEDSSLNPKHTIYREMDIIDNTECKFNVNSFKMVYVVNSESYLYKKNALKQARESHKRVSLKLHERFENWMGKWRKENVTTDQENMCVHWMMGKSEGNRLCKTMCDKIYYPDRAPYYRYNKYVVEYFDPAAKIQSE